MLGEDDPTVRWCQEMRALLKLARTVMPLEGDEGLAEADPTDNADAALLLKKSFQQRFARDPKGASEAQSERLSLVRTQFTNLFSGKPDDKTLALIKAQFEVMVKAYALELPQCTLRKDMLTRLEALAPAKGKGATLVPGAVDTDTGTLASLRDAAIDALERAASLQALAAEQTKLDAIAQERERIELKIDQRVKQAERIEADVESLKPAPEAPADSLKTEREAVRAWLVPPLSDDALVKAEDALLKLRSAWTPVEQEALALRRMRALFAAEAAKLRERVQALEASLGQKNKGPALAILGNIDKLNPKLAVRAGRTETEKVPAALDALKIDIMGLIAGMTGGGNQGAKEAAIVFMQAELARCAAEAKQLPKLDDTAEGYAEALDKSMAKARQLLGVGTGGQVSKARPEVETSSDLVTAWRAYVGPAGIVLGQRKTAAAQLIQPVNPTDADPAFGLALDAMRKQVNTSLAKPLLEVNVAEAENHAKPFPALLKRASDDAAAAKRVTAARLILATEYAGASGAARPAARTELGKAKALADTRFTLTGMDRDMALTAKLHEELVARVREVAAEGDYASTPKAPFADLTEGVRELAFTVCGPALITGMDKKGREALSAVLVSDGPAIRQLAEGPLGGSPKVFAKVLAGCGAGGLATLARALDGEGGKGARAALEGLVDKAGLGGNPELLSRLIGDAPKPGDSPELTLAKQQAQVRNAAGLKSLAENFSGDEGQAAMSALMVEGGLAASGGSLASLMQKGGFDGDGAKLRAFADAFVGDSEGLKRIVSTAGVAEHPAVLGPLASKAGAVGVKSIATAFAKPEDCAKLKGLLDGGGMGGDTSLPGKQHEHPDTLSKVFVEGLGGKGENLRTFARAFGGPGGPADSKRMLDAFNEFPDYPETPPKDYRQPGKGLKLLLGGKQLKGTPEQRITKLATQFMPNIKTIAEGDQRNQAIRMAPHMALETAQEGWKPESDEMRAAEIDSVTASVLKRHQPETYDKSKTVYEQSMFPPGTDVGDLLDQALAQVTDDRDHAQTLTVTVGPPPLDIEVEIGFLTVTPPAVPGMPAPEPVTMVNHFGPRGSVDPPHPQETPVFLQAEINAIFAAIK